MQKNSIDILVVDDHTLFRKGMVMLLKTFPETGRVKDASNGKEALELMSKEPFHILLLDLDMPVMDGMETSKRVLKDFENTYIIMVSMYDSLSTISKLIESGVHSYLLKSAKPDEVQKAMISVMNNDFYYNQLVATALRKKVEDNSSLRLSGEQHGLTRREVEILELICQEMTMKEISEQLFISEQTIHTHRKNIMRKTEAKNAVGLVKYAIKQNLVSF